MRWYKLAAKQDYEIAQYNLGLSYEQSRGVNEDEAETVRWCKLAAEQGYARTQCILGFSCEQGHGMDEDKAEAVRWYKLAAEQGYRKAQSSLGAIYEQPIILSPHPQALIFILETHRSCVRQLEDLLEIFTGYFIGSLL